MIFEEIQDYFEDSIKENIWNGRIELKKILDLLSQKQFCRSTNNKSNAFYVSYFKYYHEQNNGSFNQIIIRFLLHHIHHIHLFQKYGYTGIL